MSELLKTFSFLPFETLDQGIDTIQNYIRYTPKKEEIEFITMLLVLKEYDEDTFLHSLEVGILNYELAKSLDEPLSIQHDLFFGGLIHDCGKIAFTPNLFSGKKTLTESEKDSIRNHPLIGHKIATTVTDNPLILKLVLEHHENLEGTGYPNQKADLSLYTQIITMCDIFSAITRKRYYREKVIFSINEAFEELAAMKTKINQDLVSILKDMITQKKQVAI